MGLGSFVRSSFTLRPRNEGARTTRAGRAGEQEASGRHSCVCLSVSRCFPGAFESFLPSSCGGKVFFLDYPKSQTRACFGRGRLLLGQVRKLLLAASQSEFTADDCFS